MRMKSGMMRTLSQIAETRQRLASGKATDRELRSAVKKSLKLAVNSTNRMIQLAVEVLLHDHSLGITGGTAPRVTPCGE